MTPVLPLSGVLVVAAEQAVAAPLATRQLADLGARVIKIERPGTGDFARHYDHVARGLSGHFAWLNRSKESLTLDLKAPEGQTILHRLLERADVFVQNLIPGAAERLGFGPATLVERYPRLVVCRITGYGPDGPYRDKKAYDLLIQAATGLIAVTGTPETPSRVGFPVADVAAGMYAFSGILAALFERERSGRGRQVEVAMFEALAEWLQFPLMVARYQGRDPERSGARHPTIAPYGPFPVGDGTTLYVGLQNDREWARFAAVVLGRPELADDPRFATPPARVANREALEALIVAAFVRLDTEAVIARLEQAQIAWSRLNAPHDLLDHPQLQARGRWRSVTSEAGPIEELVPPITLVGDDWRFDPIPALGAHTDAILEELGYDAAARAALRARGVV
ncbi:MAG: CoA transferase [Actinomycetia bacterium]|nr:CoA transferase [Actinomycetes bacterium]